MMMNSIHNTHTHTYIGQNGVQLEQNEKEMISQQTYEHIENVTGNKLDATYVF